MIVWVSKVMTFGEVCAPHHSKRLGKISRIFWSNILTSFNSDASPLSSVNLLILRQSLSAASMDIRLRPLSKVEQTVEGSINGLKLLTQGTDI